MKRSAFRSCVWLTAGAVLLGGIGMESSAGAKPPEEGRSPAARPERPARPESRPSRPESRPARPESRPSRPESRPSRPMPTVDTRPTPVRPGTQIRPRPENDRPSRPEPQRPDRPGSPDRPSRPDRPSFRPSQPQDRPGDRPNARPGDRPQDRPGDRPQDRPGDRPNAHPGDRPQDRPGDRPNARPGDRPGDHPDFRPNARPGDRPNGRPDFRPAPPHPPHHPDYHPPHHPDYRPPHPPYFPYFHHFHRPLVAGPLFFLPPPLPVYYQEQIIVYPPTVVDDGLEYYDDAPVSEEPAMPTLEDLNNPLNRFYSWDAFRFYGWLQQYEPFHPSWREACNQGIGFAVSYDLPLSRYYYYPPHCMRPGTELIDAGTGAPVVFGPSEENQKILPIIQNTLSQDEVDAAWDLIYGADQYFQNGREIQAEENYARAAIALPEMPDPWFRQAVVQASRGNYPQAVLHAVRCLELSRAWPASPMTLDRMFGFENSKKQEFLDSLRNAAVMDPQNAELQMLYGLMLYADSLGDMQKGKFAMLQFQVAMENNPQLERYLGNLTGFLDSEVKRIEAATDAEIPAP